MTRRRRNVEIRAQASLDHALHVSIHGGKGANRPWKQAMKDLADGST